MDDTDNDVSDQNNIYIGLKIVNANSQITISSCLLDSDKRQIMWNEFHDNDHYSLLESYLAQVLPQEMHYNVEAVAVGTKFRPLVLLQILLNLDLKFLKTAKP